MSDEVRKVLDVRTCFGACSAAGNGRLPCVSARCHVCRKSCRLAGLAGSPCSVGRAP